MLSELPPGKRRAYVLWLIDLYLEALEAGAAQSNEGYQEVHEELKGQESLLQKRVRLNADPPDL